jgi:Undecaprenyl-phosphate glucose phosphotransferase
LFSIKASPRHLARHPEYAATTRARDLGARSPLRAGRTFLISYRSVGVVCGTAEFLTILVTSIFTGSGYSLISEGIVGYTNEYIVVGILVASLYCSSLAIIDFYEPIQLLNKNLSPLKLLMIWTGVFTFLSFLAFTAKVGSHFSRGAELSFYLFGFASAVAARRITSGLIGKAVATGAFTGPRIAVIFECERSGRGALLNDLRQYGYIVMKDFPVLNGNGYGKAADNVIAYAQRNVIDEVLILVSWHRRREINQILTRLRRIAAPVRLLADQQVQPFAEYPIRRIGPTLAVELRRAPLTRFQQTLKRSTDLVLAGMGLMLLSPVLLVIAVLIRLESPGPILFRQKRIGLNGQSFSIFKFRTMFVTEDGPSIRQATVNDVRITHVGRRLRRSSLDEVPQLINVLRGEMSLVGPRPHAEVHDSTFDAALGYYGWRRNVKPGITGWAQVNGCRGETADNKSISRRVDYDLWYAENWSLGLDLRILVRTLPVVFGARNAY